MFKGNRKYIWLFFTIFSVLVAVQYFLPKPINWSRTYSHKDKAPFGTYAIFNLLEPSFGKKTEINKSTLYNIHSSQHDNCLIVINESVMLSNTDINNIFNFIKEGNTIFIAANYLYGSLADTFKIETRFKSYQYYYHLDSLIKNPGIQLKFTAKNLSDSLYKYPLLCQDSYYSHFDSTKFSVLSVNEDNNAVLLCTSMEKGKLYLMCVPDVFTNYFIVNHPNRYYTYGILSKITQNTKTILWDEYYKNYNKKNTPVFKLIFENDSLYTAYLLLIFTIITYMIFDGRRRQRAIPTIEETKNTTLEFVEVVSHVYFNSGNHHHIAIERIKYFYDSIRNRFGIAVNEVNEDFINNIVQLSGNSEQSVRQLFKYCEKLLKSNTANEFDLIELNRQINNFNKHSLR